MINSFSLLIILRITTVTIIFISWLAIIVFLVVSLLVSGFPPIGQKQTSHSDPSISLDHSPANLAVSRPFNVLTRSDLLRDHPLAVSTIALQNSKRMNWGSEADIVHFVVNALTDVLFLTRLQDKVQLYQELSFFKLQPCVSLVRFVFNLLT